MLDIFGHIAPIQLTKTEVVVLVASNGRTTNIVFRIILNLQVPPPSHSSGDGHRGCSSRDSLYIAESPEL